MLRVGLFAWFPVRPFKTVGLRQSLTMLRRWQLRARQRRQLGRLDDALLKDIGLTRCEAEMEASKPFWRD